MMGKSHLVISTGITLSVLGMTNQEITLPVIGVTALSALLPDIDEPNSLLVSRALPKRLLRLFQLILIGVAVFVQLSGTAFAPWNSLLAVLVAFFLFMPTRTLRNIMMVLIGIGLIGFGHPFVPWNSIFGSTLLICAFVRHRGLTHTLYGVIAWALILYCSTHPYGHTLWIAGCLSYLLHLLADACTNRGIRPLPPFHYRLSFRLMSTGTHKGFLVESIFCSLTVVLLWFVFFGYPFTS